jgi:hypothetical protein
MAKKVNSGAKAPKGKEVAPIELKKYETFLDTRLQEYLEAYAQDGNKLGVDTAARLMKSMRIFVEQSVRRIAYRNGWTWPQPNTTVKANNSKKKK